MAELKTKPTDSSVLDYLNTVENEKRRADSFVILDLMQSISGAEPVMWGDSIIGFGSYRYKYASGRQGEWFVTGFAPRKGALTLYIMSGFEEYDQLLEKLGKFNTGKACLYINKLEDIDMDILRDLVNQSIEHMTGSNE